MQHPFRTRLEQRRVTLADGAMGTQLYERGVGTDRCFDAQNLDGPSLVEQIHRDYIRAGAELIETNTFGANRFRLGAFGLDDRVREINQKGARIARGAREISGEAVFVAGSIGPTGRALQPFGHASGAEVYEAFREQVAGLLEGGVDLFVLETFSDLLEIAEALRAVRDACDLPVVAQMTFAEDVRTPQGYSPEQVADVLIKLDVDVIGANCSVGSNTLLEVSQRLLAAGATAVSAMPNAGWPTREGNRVIYLSSPEYMAEMGRRMADVGVALVGGCCGTTPLHIRVLREALEVTTSSPVEAIRTREPVVEGDETTDVSELAGKLGSRRVLSVEIRPPRGANPAKALEGARLLRAAGVDAVNVLDSAMSRVRMSAVASSVLIKQRVGIETILHFTTRDRNLMAIQSDLIGAHAMGIRTVLALTGDPPSIGDYAQSKAVYDVDSIGLIRIIKLLNAGVDIGGNSVGTPTRFLVGCALNPTAEDLDLELSRFRQKLEAGADFVMTQPVYDADLFERVLDATAPIDVPIMMGILPLQSYRHALFLHNELPGVKLTDAVLQRMERAGADGIREGMLIAHEMIEACGHSTAGLYIVPSFGRYEAAAQLVANLLVRA
jgi:methionine synthase I (cobalamin-dependent)/5,10-methylenetetrahydrofolate reductase